MKIASLRWLVAAAAATVLLAACGGGGGNPGECRGSPEVCNPSSGVGPAPADGAIPASDTVANICTLDGQKQFTRAYINEAYLWYNQVPAVNAAGFSTVESYFDALVAIPKDRFSFIQTAASADNMSTGVGAGYGADWILDSADRIRVAQVAPGSPAAAAGLARGGELIRGTAVGDLFPDAAPASITFSYRPSLIAATRTVSMNAVQLREDPVPQSRVITTASNKRAGYLLFNAHIEGAQDKLIGILSTMQTAGLDTMVLDLRYNRGGYIYTALSLATMLSGPAADNKVFEKLQFNDKRAQDTADAAIVYTSALQVSEGGFQVGDALPRLSLPRVYVLSTENTCSASESIINGLRGVDVEVVLVGDTTCGKPYGFSRKDNCGLSYFPIEFQGTNAKGFGDYANGFAANCKVADDLDRPLGDTTEGLLAAALYHVDAGACPPGTASAAAAPRVKKASSSSALMDITRPRMPGRLLTPRN